MISLSLSLVGPTPPAGAPDGMMATDASRPPAESADTENFGEVLALLLAPLLADPAPVVPIPLLGTPDGATLPAPEGGNAAAGKETPSSGSLHAEAAPTLTQGVSASASQVRIDGAAHGVAADGTEVPDTARATAAGSALREALMAMHRQEPRARVVPGPAAPAAEPPPVPVGAPVPALRPTANGTGDARVAEVILPEADTHPTVASVGIGAGSDSARNGREAEAGAREDRQAHREPAVARPKPPVGVDGLHALVLAAAVTEGAAAEESSQSAAGHDSHPTTSASALNGSLSAPVPARPISAVRLGASAEMAAPQVEAPSPAPAPSSSVTIQLDPGTTGATRLRVALRGDVVHATIVADAVGAGALALRMPELQRALRDRGFADAQLTVRTQGVEGTATLAAPRLEPSAAAPDSGQTRDGAEQRAGQRRSNQDDRPRQQQRDPEPEEYR